MHSDILATKGWTKETDIAIKVNRCRFSQDVEQRLIWKPRVPESCIYASNIKLRQRPHQTAVSAIPKSMEHTGKLLNI